jgi:hypothetical protein
VSDVIYGLALAEPFWLYHKRGWSVLLDDLPFPGVARPYRSMGLELDCENVA